MTPDPPEPLCEVLAVDDDADMSKLVCASLPQSRYRVRVLGRGADVEAAFAADPPDLLLLDLGLPDVPGDEVFRRIQARSPGFPVVFLTANASVDRAVALMREGALDYLTKPARPEVILARVEAARARVMLAREVEDLRALCGPPGDLGPGFVLGTDPAMLAVARRIGLVARTDAPVLVLGESGTGKELYGRAVHRASRRKAGPFVAVNTAAIPETLWERELFGHKRGAFSDARADSPGLIAAAEHGTLFLDEVGEMPAGVQVKLLRFLQDREYRPVGSTQVVRADVRVVCATHRDLKERVAKGAFREDLYYRLHVVPVKLPPLRERRGDIPILAQHFVARYAREFGIAVTTLTPAATARLCSHDWPGNVRELENVIQQAVAVATRPVLSASDLPLPGDDFAAPPAPDAPEGDADEPIAPLDAARQRVVDAFERDYARRLLVASEGNITRAAELAGISRKTLWALLKRLGIDAVRDGVVSKPGRPRSR